MLKIVEIASLASIIFPGCFDFAGVNVDKGSGQECDSLLVGIDGTAAGFATSGLIDWLIAGECLLCVTNHACETVDSGLIGASFV